MKLEKKSNGFIVLVDDSGNHVSGMPGGQYVHRHPIDDDAVFVSDTSNTDNYHYRVVIRASEVTEAFGAPFSGSRDDLATLLCQNF